MAAVPEEILPDLWRWSARHPEWHPGEFGAEVGCYAAKAGGDVLAVDPLLPPDPAGVLALLDGLITDRLAIFITIPYHVRSAEALWERYGANSDVTIWGHPACAARLSAAAQALLRDPRGAGVLPGGVRSFAIGSPVRFERPLLLPSHEALVFGDAVANVGGRLRVWIEGFAPRQRRWYEERFLPTLAPLVDLQPDRILVTHGEPVLRGGADALAAALAAPPWSGR